MVQPKLRARRFPFVAPITLTDLESSVQLKAGTSNLSVFGCHIATAVLWPVGTKIRIRIAHNGASCSALGRIVYGKPMKGMGILLTRVESIDQTVLDGWLAALRARRGLNCTRTPFKKTDWESIPSRAQRIVGFFFTPLRFGFVLEFRFSGNRISSVLSPFALNSGSNRGRERKTCRLKRTTARRLQGIRPTAAQGCVTCLKFMGTSRQQLPSVDLQLR